MDLSAKYKLRVMLNTIFDVAPAWIYEKYPDASMITLGGKVIGPQTQPHRQIGGLGYCFNNDKVTAHQFEFLAAAVKEFRIILLLKYGMWEVNLNLQAVCLR
jgi:beta-galactosidase